MGNSHKLVIVINGAGGVGKDTMCDIISKHFKTANVSSIDPIKNIARNCGWGGEKDEKSRKMLSDLKRLFIDYNDLPLRYLKDAYENFLINDELEILFVHIRESEEIQKFKNVVSGKCATLLIRRGINSNTGWNNKSDDDVEDYLYDFYYENNKKLVEVESDFLAFFKQILNNPEYNIG